MPVRSPTPATRLQSIAVRYRGWGRATGWQQREPRGPRRARKQAEPAPQREPESAEAGMRRLEAVLLLSREPVNSRKLSQFASLADGTQARVMVGKLNQRYDTAGRAFRVEEVGGGFQLMTRPQLARWLRPLGHLPSELRLSGPAMETLAVVAYRQPVARADVEAVRGVACGEILRQLLERDLLRICGRSEELGRPYLYGTSRQFLQAFGLRSLDELPRADIFQGNQPDPTEDSAVETSDSASQLTPDSSSLDEEESEVSVAIGQSPAELNQEEETDALPVGADGALVENPHASIDDDDDEEWDDDDDDEDEDEDDDDFDFEDDDDEEDDDDLDEDEDDDDEWEEVDDDEEEDDEDDDDVDDDEEEDEDEWEDDDEEWAEDEDDDDWDNDEEDEDDVEEEEL